MQEKLVIKLQLQDLSRPDWAVIDTEGATRQSADNDSPEGLAEIATDKEIIVFVPEEDVLAIEVVMPPMNRSRLLKAVPYALEEQLIDDVDNLHFAIGDRDADGKVNVAVVSKAKMTEWLALLSSWHLSPDELQANQSTINLLQGVYKTKKRKLPLLNSSRKIIIYMASAWVFLLFFSPIVSYFILHSSVTGIDTQIAAIYKRQFPNASSIVAPKQRMQDKLDKLANGINQNRWLLLLGHIGKGMQQTPNIQLKKLDYQNNQLTLQLSASNADNFSAFSNYLLQQGLSVKQQNADLNNGRVNAVLLIE